MENSCLTAKPLVRLREQRCGNNYRQVSAKTDTRTLASVLEDFSSLKKSLKADNSLRPLKDEQYIASQSILLPSLIFSNKLSSGLKSQKEMNDKGWVAALSFGLWAPVLEPELKQSF